jgi:CDP-glucose 4,6-dehydratase
VRATPSVKAVVIVTSDKAYYNDERGRAFREGDRLGGSDPYSASKACQEIVTESYRKSFFSGSSVHVGSARAGNVIGGGDWAADRLIPDFIRASGAGKAVAVRNPDALRPWQHVLEPLAGYLTYAERLHAGSEVPTALNFGPPTEHMQPVRWVIEQLAEQWGGGAQWQFDEAEAVPEAQVLTLDASLAARALGWQPKLALDRALLWTTSWYRAHREGRDMRAYSLDEIQRYRDLGP